VSLADLQTWLLDEGIRPELNLLTRMTVVTEIDNFTTIAETANTNHNLDWNRLLMAASILAQSVERRFQEAALRVATAALTLDTPLQVRDSGAILLGKLSNHRAIALAKAREYLGPGLEGRLGVSLRLEAQRRRFENAVLVESTGNWLPVNGFQHSLWLRARHHRGWLSASAPTASGKTFLVLQWLIDSMTGDGAQVAVYLAPTRALVTEIENSLRAMLGSTLPVSLDVTSLPLRDKYEAAITGIRKLVFVFTQERLHLLANLLSDKIRVDFLVVDEAHKIGDNQRGVVLQDAVERVSRTNPTMRVVFISPATQNPAELLADAPEGTETLSVDNDVPTVLQNVIVATQVPRKPKEWKLELRENGERQTLGILSLVSKPANIRKRIAFIAAAAGERGGTLIYTNGPAEAEEIALLVSQLTPRRDSTDPELAALAELARKGVHQNYQLAPLVERGVAFHYGNMPSLIRIEIERLFRTGKIRFLACTSTLIEGVNLSCRTIVLRGPRKGRGNPMEPHDFWNLAGRAGRWGDEFQGNIICIDPDDAEAWPRGIPSRARYPIRRETDSVLGQGDNVEAYLSTRRLATVQDLVRSAQLEQVSAYLIATYLRLGSVAQTGLAKRHDAKRLERIDNALAELVYGIDITPEIATRHPGVSAFAMQTLLQTFRDYDGDIEDLLPAPPESDDAYDRLKDIMERINTSLYPAFQPPGLVPLHALTVLEWLKGFSLATIIQRRIQYQRVHERVIKVAKTIRETMELIEQTARFRAPKYLAAYIDILKIFLREQGRENLIDSDLDIGIQLEFGISSLTLLSLMELGLSRMSAVALYEKIARDDLDKDGCLAWLAEHNEQFDGLDIPAIIVREIREKLLSDGAPPDDRGEGIET
jgi:superfamily II DNA/RNA helicase